MARHIHIYLPARVRDTAPAPQPNAIKEMIDRLFEALKARGHKTADAGFDESKVKRDEGGKFSAQQHMAAASEHDKGAGHHEEAAAKSTGSEKAKHEAAAKAHMSASAFHQQAKNSLRENHPKAPDHSAQAHSWSAKAIEASKALTPQGKRGELDTLVSNLAETVDPAAKKRDTARANELKKELDEGGKFSAQQHSAAAQEHKQAEQHHQDEQIKLERSGKSNSPEEIHHSQAQQLHRNAAYSHTEASYALQNKKPDSPHVDAAHKYSALAKEFSSRNPSPPPPKSPFDAAVASDKPTKSTAKGKAGAHELLSSGHPFSVDELMAATGVTNRTTMLTALSDLKNPKYAGSKGALNIVKRADGSYHVQKSDAPAPAAKTQSKNPGGFNTSQPDPKAAKPVAHASATGQSFLPKVKTSQVNTNTKAGSNLLGSFLKQEHIGPKKK